ncbi:MAG: hypothetical protein AAFN70_06870 [Planctomycetota bacterium]
MFRRICLAFLMLVAIPSIALSQQRKANRLTGGDKKTGSNARLSRTYSLLRPDRAIVMRVTQLSAPNRTVDDDRINVDLKIYRERLVDHDQDPMTPRVRKYEEFAEFAGLRGSAARDARFSITGNPRQRFISFAASNYVDADPWQGMVQVWGNLDTGVRQGNPAQTNAQAQRRRFDDELHVQIRLPRNTGSDPCEDYPDDDILGDGGDYDEEPDYPDDYGDPDA